MASTDLGRVAIGNEEVQFLPPSFEQSRSTAEMLIAYMDWCGIEKAVLMPNPCLLYTSLESFRHSFNQVYSMEPEQLQLGFLKVLKLSLIHIYNCMM